jgi:hypothetical protein
MKITVKTPAEFKSMIKLFDELPDTLADEAVTVWRVAIELFYDKTQQIIHVDSGDLKRSGKATLRRNKLSVVGTVSYGDNEVDYAIYEEERGGSHAFMARAYEMTQSTFQAAMPQIWQNAIRRAS